MTYPIRRIAPLPYLMEPRPNRSGEIAGVMIHATRSGVSDGDDGPRTERWMTNPNNGSTQQGWGSSYDEIIFESGERCLVALYEKQAPTYGAGYGGAGTWSAGWYYYQIGVAQGGSLDAYTPAETDSLAERVAELAVRHGFPIVRISYLNQIGTPPPGICAHETSANGVKLGKSDPGSAFPWATFLQKTEAKRQALTTPVPIPISVEEEPKVKLIHCLDTLNVYRVGDYKHYINDTTELAVMIRLFGTPMSVYQVEADTIPDAPGAAATGTFRVAAADVDWIANETAAELAERLKA